MRLAYFSLPWMNCHIWDAADSPLSPPCPHQIHTCSKLFYLSGFQGRVNDKTKLTEKNTSAPNNKIFLQGFLTYGAPVSCTAQTFYLPQILCPLPLFKSLFSHLTSSSVNFFWNSILLSLGDLVNLVASIKAIRTPFASQSCSVSAT